MINSVQKFFPVLSVAIPFVICIFLTSFEPFNKPCNISSKDTVAENTKHETIYINSILSNKLDLLGLEGYLEHFFPDCLFRSSFHKTETIDGVNAIYLAYKKHFSQIYLWYNVVQKEYDVVFTLSKNNRKFHFANGAMLPDEVYQNKKKYVPYYYSYPTNDGIMISHYPIVFSSFIFGMDRDYEFYYDLYGRNRKEVNDNLKFVYFGKYRFPLNAQTDCYNKALDVFKYFEQIRYSNKVLTVWFNSIKSISSFSPRLIANSSRPSTHTFSISMDILTRDYRPNYWYWTSKFNKNWWTVPENKRAFVPKEVILAFENNGFCWGGKWERYDIMHFEYKPENFYKKIR